ncbi:MAG: MFS transporter [Alphaproteobacteria bacterium]|nr:MFS transporter [Alphaproteobacteria bacterium]
MEKASSINRRVGFIIVLSNIFNAMAVDIYLPSLPLIQKYFNTSEYKTQLIIVGFYFGAVLSRLFWGPFSDILGRRRAILAAYSIQAFFQLLCIYSPNIDCIILFRVLQSLGSGVTGVIGTAIIADYYTGNERARMLNIVELSFIIAFIFAPSFGVVLNEIYGWQGGFVFIFLSYIFSFLLFYYFLPVDIIRKPQLYINIIPKLFNIYKNDFNWKILKFSFISGISAGLFMGFAIKAPFIYFLKFSISSYEYIIFQMSPFVINFVISVAYKKIIDKISITKTISLCMYALVLLSIFSLCVAQEIIYSTKYTYFFIMCYISAIMPFLIAGGITLALKDVISKGAGSSISASIRSLCLFSVMYATTMISTESYHIFYIIPFLTISLIMLWCSIKNTA